MGYQALLFCPDEKTARIVTQVLSELDFAVTPCTEPFAAVKKLMAEHFDAIVVDCDNEQNATLLFKSARNTTTNQSSLAVAVVEGQAGVAKAFRIGANLVLTKPINGEQAKGTLRVARGLLRKNEGTKPATAASVKPVATVSTPRQEVAILPRDVVSSSPSIAAATASDYSRTPASSSADHLETDSNETVSPVIERPATQPYPSEVGAASAQAKNGITPSRAGFSNSAASAPAPARDSKPNVSTEEKSAAVLPQVESTASGHEVEKNSFSMDGASGPVPTFTFGGTLGSNTESTSGSKKVLFVAAAVVLIAAASYAAWSHWGRSDDSTTVPNHVAESPVKAPAPISHAPSQTPIAKSSTPDMQTSGSAENTQYPPSKSTVSSDSSKPSPSSALVNKAPATKEDTMVNKAPETTKEDAEPIVIKNNPSRPATKSVTINNAPPPPSMAAIAPAPGNDGALLNLMDNHSSAPTPVLQTLSVSQGVSQGLLVKKVQPKYPQNALRLRVEGAVQLMATISQSGDISVVKIVSGDSQLAHAAVDAVKQWKYKPYLLNGSPVEIQTQITVNFKLPN
ncbi:MAG: periplasmic protein TonB [Acidobacteriaceae bacterium]|nr:periplasmic protein TonB [Acidobacteriaceae bacterium]